MKNKFNKSFGPVAFFAGIIMFLVGIAILWQSLLGIILIISGAFTGFSFSATSIDFNNKRVRCANYLFGIIPSGRWINVQNDMSIGIKKSDLVWKAYSRSNRSIEIPEKHFLVVLFDSQQKILMPLQKAQSLSEAKEIQNTLSEKLSLTAI